jgi:hypothetical protein
MKRAAALVVACLLGSGVNASRTQMPAPWTLRDLFESYRGGTFGGVARLTAEQWSTVVTPGHLTKETMAWLHGVDAPEQQVRIRTSALVAAELYDGCAHLRGCDPRWLHGELEWIADRLSSSPPSSFERLWFLSVIAIATGAEQVRFVAPPPGLGRGPARYGLARLARERFPDEPRFRLQEIVARRPARTVARGPATRLDVLAGLSRVSEGSARAYFRDTLSQLEGLSGDEQVGKEARLRSAMIRVLLGDLPAGLADAVGASSSSDRWTRFLALQLAGRIHTHTGNLGEAVTFQELANAEYPGARSGVTALASALFAVGRNDEAYDAMDSLDWNALERNDPWIQYGWGDYRNWLSDYRPRLRGLITS